MSINWSQINGLTTTPNIIAGGHNKLLATRKGPYYKLAVGTKSNTTGGWSEKSTSYGIKSIYFF